MGKWQTVRLQLCSLASIHRDGVTTRPVATQRAQMVMSFYFDFICFYELLSH